MAFDLESGKIVLLAEAPNGDTASTWTFDVCSNTWLRMDPKTEPPTGIGGIVYDVDSDLTVAAAWAGTAIWAYDLEADTWTQKADAFAGGGFRLVYDPVSGLIVRQIIQPRHPKDLWAYDVDTDSWYAADQEGARHPGRWWAHELTAYDASVDRVVAYVPGSGCRGCDDTRLLDLRTGSWTASDARTPELNTGYVASGGEIAYDEAAKRVVVFSDGFVAAYNATADRWTGLYGRSRCCAEGPLNRLGHWMVYDPVNERLVVYGGSARGVDPGRRWSQMNDVWAFDVAAREWIQLLARSTST